MEREWGNGERGRKWRESFSLHFLAARLQGSSGLRNPVPYIDQTHPAIVRHPSNGPKYPILCATLNLHFILHHTLTKCSSLLRHTWAIVPGTTGNFKMFSLSDIKHWPNYCLWDILEQWTQVHPIANSIWIDQTHSTEMRCLHNGPRQCLQ